MTAAHGVYRLTKLLYNDSTAWDVQAHEPPVMTAAHGVYRLTKLQ